MRRTHYALALMIICSLAGCSGGQSAADALGSNADTLPAIDGDRLLAHIKVLASDSFQGRLPGTEGEERTVKYLEAQFKQLGLKPGNTDGSYIQKVPLVGITPDPSAALLVEIKGGKKLTFKFRDDVVAWTKHVAPLASITNSDIVFVGYGVEAPEFQWDDFKGLDVSGKTLVMLVNDPPVPDPKNPAALDSTVFGGRAMTYYGRWTYKYEMGAKKHAAAVLIVHETGPSGYPFAVVQGKTGEQFDLVTPDQNAGRSAIEGWIALDKAKEMFALAGQDFDALKKAAGTRAFKPVALGLSASMTIHNKLRVIDSRNVVAKLEGSDPKLADEYVVYTGHWDHFGIGQKINCDSIYNGAVDNASGTAALLELARAYTQLKTPPKRSILFLSVTAEEQGLLGSQYYAVTPIYPLAKTLADINIDGLGFAGKTKDLTLIGYGASDLDDYAKQAASEQGRTIRPDPEPEKGYYYRSDHFNFAKQGVPALDAESGIDVIGKPAGFGMQARERYVAEDYHKPSDDVKPDWDLSGAVQDVQLVLTVGYRVAQSAKYPEWRPGNEFRAIRDAQLKAAGK